MCLQCGDDERRDLPAFAVFVVSGFYRFFYCIGSFVHDGCTGLMLCARYLLYNNYKIQVKADNLLCVCGFLLDCSIGLMERRDCANMIADHLGDE
jgi:hypothetical protein